MRTLRGELRYLMHISIDHSCRYMTKMNTRVGDSMRAKHRLRKSLPYYLYLDNMKYNPRVSHCGLLKSAFLVKYVHLGVHGIHTSILMPWLS